MLTEQKKRNVHRATGLLPSFEVLLPQDKSRVTPLPLAGRGDMVGWGRFKVSSPLFSIS
jgi:hypothetical protein